MTKNAKVGERIRQRRTDLGMTQEDLAKRLGYSSPTSITKIESSDRGLPQWKVQKIAEVLKTSPSYLMGWDDVFIDEQRTIEGRTSDLLKYLEKVKVERGPEPKKPAVVVTREKYTADEVALIDMLRKAPAVKRLQAYAAVLRVLNEEDADGGR